MWNFLQADKLWRFNEDGNEKPLYSSPSLVKPCIFQFYRIQNSDRTRNFKLKFFKNRFCRFGLSETGFWRLYRNVSYVFICGVCMYVSTHPHVRWDKLRHLLLLLFFFYSLFHFLINACIYVYMCVPHLVTHQGTVVAISIFHT